MNSDYYKTIGIPQIKSEISPHHWYILVLQQPAHHHLLEASVNNSNPNFLDRGSGKWSSMDSHVYQGKSSEMTSTDSLTLGSEENQQTNCQLAAYARDAIRHLEYKNPNDVGLTTRRISTFYGESSPCEEISQEVPLRREARRRSDMREGIHKPLWHLEAYQGCTPDRIESRQTVSRI